MTCGSLALVIGGLLLVRRNVSIEDLKSNHEVASVMVAVLGTLYAIVLGLIVVDAIARRELAQQMEANEGSALATVYHLARSLTVASRKPILRAELDYLKLATTREWDALEKGVVPEPETQKAYFALWQAACGYEPKTGREQNIHASILSSMDKFGEARRYRNVRCKHEMPSLLWVILIGGGICTTGFTYFFGTKSVKAQVMMTSVVTIMLCMNILLVLVYRKPYAGDMRIEPSTTLHVRERLTQDPLLQKEEGAR